MENILENVLVFDGAMGTMLQKEGLQGGYCPELMNIEYPEKVKRVHEQYINAGADVITTNTFGGSIVKLKEYELEDKIEEVNIRGVEIAREAAIKTNAYVAASVGPTGLFVEPIGNTTFEEIYEIFKSQIRALAKGKPDFIILETFSDLGEIRAALLAAKDVCDIPVICSLTYDGKRTLTGVSPQSAAVVLEGMGAAAIGVNCSGGPKELFIVAKILSENTALPIIVQPNAGLPIVKEGRVFYPLSSTDFVAEMKKYLKLGINLFGSCCGSTPEYTKKLKAMVKDFKILNRNIKKGSAISSTSKVVRIGDNNITKIIGERINPTANKKIANGLKNDELDIIQSEIYEQVKGGAHLIDINVGLADIDENKSMRKIIDLFGQNIDTPIVIDSTNPKIIENALKNYHGKALVNSINGEEESINSILPMVKRYGAGIIGLTLDNNGIPSTAIERYVIAEKIVEKCISFGIKKEDIYIDTLVLTVGTDTKAAIETLKTLKMIKENLGVNTVLGVSNISHGLPNRSKLNSTFLSLAIANGLDLAIINPLDNNMIDAWQAASLLSGRDENGANYINFNKIKKNNNEIKKADIKEYSIEALKDSIIIGSHSSLNITQKLLEKGIDSGEIINKGLIEALNIVGEKFEEGEYFLPQLMLSAEVSKKIFEYIESTCDNNIKTKKSTIIIGTVKGDIHDIGKNMVATMLKSHGFDVIDLGKNVSKEEFLQVAKNKNAEIIALSALMTTTMTEIPKTIEYIKTYLPKIKIIVGGAVVTNEFAKKSGATGYSKDAVEAVRLVESLI